jgi:hypothetical protein
LVFQPTVAAMRLICGILHLDGAPAQAATLARMLDALSSSGPRTEVRQRISGSAALAVLDFHFIETQTKNRQICGKV